MQLKKTIQNNLFPFIVFMILVAGCCFAWYFFHPSSPYHARYRFVVSYQTIGTLSPGNRVIVRGIERGKILAVELTDDAVFVTVEVLAEAKISRHSQFRLINAGLMGEREMCVLTAEDQDWIADGDTVYGSFDDGLSGLGDVLSKAIADLDEMKGTLTARKGRTHSRDRRASLATVAIPTVRTPRRTITRSRRRAPESTRRLPAGP